jgi:hypothetical protein
MIMTLWKNIQLMLDLRLTGWRDRINSMGQTEAVESRQMGRTFTDSEVFQGIVKAVLSNSTDFSRIERIIQELHELFRGFDLNYYASLTEEDIEETFLPWFCCRFAGSLTMRSNLNNLIDASIKLISRSQQHGSLENFFNYIKSRQGNHPINLVLSLGSQSSLHKLSAMGIPIAAEAMKNIGYDVAKPDRHINRALGSFGMVHFSKWKDCSKCQAPQANEDEMRKVMTKMDSMARDVNEPVVFLDNAIWLLCSKSGLHLSNAHLKALVA